MLEFTPEQRSAMKTMEEYAEQTIARETNRLRELIEIVNHTANIQLVDGHVESTLNLTSTEMEVLAMKIPAECLYLQGLLNQYNTRNTFRDLFLGANMTVSLSSLVGSKGTADERKRMAEFGLLDEKIQNAVNKVIIKGIEGCIARADKVYEGVKKVMDYRSREGWFDRKGT